MIGTRLPSGDSSEAAAFQTSRRSLLASFTLLSLALPSTLIGQPQPSPCRVTDEFGGLWLCRTSEGRKLSRLRYHNAEGFLRPIRAAGCARLDADTLYRSGIVIQLGLSAHLLDVGFEDEWCAREIGLNVSRSLRYANATGLGFANPNFELLATLLSPYSKWRNCCGSDATSDLSFTRREVHEHARSLLDHIRGVTGHPRPRGFTREL